MVVIMLVVGKIKQRSNRKTQENTLEPTIGGRTDDYDDADSIIAIRKQPTMETHREVSIEKTPSEKSIMLIHVMSKENKVFAGYELLQALLSSGLRFGKMSIFHRYRESNGKEEVLFSLASATEPGTFDMLNMGAFSCKGLTLFMQQSGDTHDDKTRHDLMLQTARHLSEDLAGILLDADRKPMIPPAEKSRVLIEDDLASEQ